MEDKELVVPKKKGLKYTYDKYVDVPMIRDILDEIVYKNPTRFSNLFIENAEFDYNLNESKLSGYITTLFTPPKKEGDKLKYNLVYKIYYSDFFAWCGKGHDNKGGSQYDSIRDAAKGLMDKSIMIDLPEKCETDLKFVDHIFNNKKDGYLIVSLHPLMIPYLMANTNFLKSSPEYVALANNKYTPRIYRFISAEMKKREGGAKKQLKKDYGISSNKDISSLESDARQEYANKFVSILNNTYRIFIDEEILRKRLKIPASYKGQKMIMQKVIEPSIKDINDYTETQITDCKYDSKSKAFIFTVRGKTPSELDEKRKRVNDILSKAEKKD